MRGIARSTHALCEAFEQVDICFCVIHVRCVHMKFVLSFRCASEVNQIECALDACTSITFT